MTILALISMHCYCHLVAMRTTETDKYILTFLFLDLDFRITKKKKLFHIDLRKQST
jgi:hypothetical protein